MAHDGPFVFKSIKTGPAKVQRNNASECPSVSRHKLIVLSRACHIRPMRIIMRWIFLFFASIAFADESRVVDVRRNITLSDDDKVYKDFYINGGSDNGFRKGQSLTAVRKVNVRDASGATNVGEMIVPVGELKVIAVYEKVTVAREVKLFDRTDLPMLEQKAIMTGDTVEIKK